MFNPASAIQIVADDVSQLRRSDVFRLLDTYHEQRHAIAAYLRQHRPDLAEEIADCLEELFDEEITDFHRD
jgi:hypothetical protein